MSQCDIQYVVFINHLERIIVSCILACTVCDFRCTEFRLSAVLFLDARKSKRVSENYSDFYRSFGRTKLSVVR